MDRPATSHRRLVYKSGVSAPIAARIQGLVFVFTRCFCRRRATGAFNDSFHKVEQRANRNSIIKSSLSLENSRDDRAGRRARTGGA